MWEKILDKIDVIWYYNIYSPIYWKLVDFGIIIRPDSEIKVGDYYEDCRYRPMQCLENSYGDIVGRDLIDGREGRCDYYHCAVIPLTEDEVEEHKRIYAEEGDRGLSKKYGGWTDEAYTEFERVWR